MWQHRIFAIAAIQVKESLLEISNQKTKSDKSVSSLPQLTNIRDRCAALSIEIRTQNYKL